MLPFSVLVREAVPAIRRYLLAYSVNTINSCIYKKDESEELFYTFLAGVHKCRPISFI